MTTKQDLQNLIKTIEEKQAELLKEMNVINVSDRWVAASRRARQVQKVPVGQDNGHLR